MREIKYGPEHLSKVKGKWNHKELDQVELINVCQFLKPAERIHAVNEAHRCLKVGGRLQIVSPHLSAARAYGDLAFEWPPVSEAWGFHLNAEWRKNNNPREKRYKCDFDVTVGYSIHPALGSRNEEYKQHAMQFFREAPQDVIITLIKR